jgi:hypothetical protein
MTISPNNTIIEQLYCVGSGLTSSDPFVYVYSGSDPTIHDIDYPIQKLWFNFALNKMWILYKLDVVGTQTQAVWVLFNAATSGLLLNIPVPFGSSPVLPNSISGQLKFTSSDGSVVITGSTNQIDFKSNVAIVTETITGDDGTVVAPTGGNINLLGLVVANATHAKAVFTESPSAHTEKIDIQVGAAIAATDVTKVGLVALDSGSFGVDANGFVTLLSAFTGVTGLIPQSHTSPGTSPVLPLTGNITINGAVVAAGSIPIQTDSLAAHVLRIEVQTASAIPATNATNIGLAAFDSASFGVDANGFVTILAGANVVQTLTGNSGGAIPPLTGNINTLGTGSITIVGSGHTLTTQLTGLTSHNVLIGQGTATIGLVAPSATSGVPLISQGSAADPVFGTAVVAGGGTGNTTFTAYSIICAGTTATGAFQNVSGLGTSGQVLTSNGAGALPTWQASGAGSNITGLIPDAHTAPGTSPVVPTGGNVTITGASAAAGAIPVRTNSLAANTLTIQVQTAQAIASTDATKIGLSNYNSTQFGVDGNGFVTSNNFTITAGTGLTGGGTITLGGTVTLNATAVAFPWTDEGGSFAAAASNGYFVTAVATATLPASPSQGNIIRFVVDTSGAVTIKANTGQFIRIGRVISASAGTAVSTLQGDTLDLVYRSSSTTWYANDNNGTWVVS